MHSSAPEGDQGFKPIHYFEALYGSAEALVTLMDGSVLHLQRAGLGKFLYLRTLEREVAQVPLAERVGKFATWLRLGGVDSPENLTLADLLAISQIVRALNGIRGEPAWAALPVWDEESPARYTDYPGRLLARIVDTLARHYGWSFDRIINLNPEIALAHVQECLLAERRRREWQHSLSEVAWEYDKGSGKSRYRPLPPIQWDQPITARKWKVVPQHIKDRYYPKGVIVDLTKPRTNGQQSAGT